MSDVIASRLQAIREEMRKYQLDAYIVPRADEYLGEYVPAHNERLAWITGFSGSAGVAIILKDTAAIFTDGRYTVQVRQQVNGDLFTFESLTDTPQAQWLASMLKKGAQVGIDARTQTLSWFEKTGATLAKSSISLTNTDNLVDLHWQNRPAAPKQQVMLFDDKLAGATSLSKRRQIGKVITESNADMALITSLDSCAWLLNIRGQDVPCLPVVLGTGLLSADGFMRFFTDLSKLPEGINQHVGLGVSFQKEQDLHTVLNDLDGVRLLADPDSSNAAFQLAAVKGGAILVSGLDPVAMAKAQKNPTELLGMKECHIRDGVSVSRFLAWLDAEIAKGQLYDEGELANKLESFRVNNQHFVELSFDTISAAGSNAAMCHYNHNNGTPAKLTMNSMYLVDSGAQYLDGTTDVTRTVAIGKPSAEHKKMVTLVLKGHIALDTARFPKGTTGTQLDTFARQYLWQYGYDYDHGTGHGVGHFLSVHEGPQRISKAPSTVSLLPGMVVSNEPGYYRENEFGIRLENLVAVRPCQALNNAEREMYEFEALTLIPFDLRLIEKSLLTQTEIDWLNAYHKKVFSALSPELTGNDLIWLTQATTAI